MNDNVDTQDKLQLVWAENEQEARKKFYEFWESKSEKYDVDYTSRILDITEAIS